MKKIILFTLISIVSISLAQETKSNIKEPQESIYFGGGFISNSKFNIDDKLESSNLPIIQSNVPEFVFGFSTLASKYLFDIEAGSNFFKQSNSAAVSNGSRGSVRLRVQRLFLNDNDFILSGGLNLAYTGNDFNVYSQANQVDINDLSNSTSNYIRLRNNMFYVGPSIGVGIKSKGKQVGRLNIGYEFAFLTSKWNSDYASISNSMNENGQRRLMIGAVFFINKK